MLEQRLTLVCLTGEKSPDGHLLGRYQCACGNECVIIQSRVVNGYTRSCGCLASGNNRRHGQRGSRTYSSWSAMRDRCLNPASKDFPRWGGRGITVCDRWDDFEAFLTDMGERPAGMTIDRIDGERGYEPGNCRWATPLEQARNRRDLVVVKTANGEIPLVDYAATLGITKGAAHLRLKRGTLEGVVS